MTLLTTKRVLGSAFGITGAAPVPPVEKTGVLQLNYIPI